MQQPAKELGSINVCTETVLCLWTLHVREEGRRERVWQVNDMHLKFLWEREGGRILKEGHTLFKLKEKMTETQENRQEQGMRWMEKDEEIRDDSLTSHTRTQRERALVWEGGGYFGTPEPSDMTQMQCAATVLRAEGRRVQSDSGKEAKRGGWACVWALAASLLCCHTMFCGGDDGNDSVEMKRCLQSMCVHPYRTPLESLYTWNKKANSRRWDHVVPLLAFSYWSALSWFYWSC